MQHWTKTKPNRPGYWFTRYDYSDHNYNPVSDVEVIKIGIIDGELHGLDMYLPLTDVAYDGILWGSSPICEPVGEKI